MSGKGWPDFSVKLMNIRKDIDAIISMLEKWKNDGVDINERIDFIITELKRAKIQ